MQSCPLLFVHGNLRVGGAEKLRLTVIKYLLRRGITPRVCALHESGPIAESIRDMGVSVDLLGNRSTMFDMRGAARLSRYFRLHSPLIVQASQFLANLHSALAAHRARVPVLILEEHGLYTWKRARHRIADRLVCAQADAILTCSESVAQFAERTSGFARAKLHVFHNCVDSEELDSDGTGSRIRNEFLSEPTGLLFGVVGSLRWEKGHRYLIEAWSRLRVAGTLPPGSRLLVVGKGPLENELRAAAANSPDILFLGERHDIPEILGALDVFLLPSISEGLGIAIIEAMCAGLPIISTTAGGIPELIADRRSGLLVEPGSTDALASAIATLANDRGLRAQLGAAAQEASLGLRAEAYVDKLLALYRVLLRRKGLDEECFSPPSRSSAAYATCP